MKKAAIYCRVSTEDQEKEGTSLQTQLDACLKLVKGKGYEVEEQHIIQEVYSGLSLDRPDLTKLRAWLGAGEINAVAIYSSDRFSRDGYDFLTLVRDCQRANANLLCVTEPLESGQVGELLSYVRGWAARQEAEKIIERTRRGKIAKAKAGKLPSGRGNLYGYTYDKTSGTNIANDSLDVVKMVGTWLIEECIFLNEACRRLMQMNIPTPRGGKLWYRRVLSGILRNSTYAGKTYVFKIFHNGKKRTVRPKEEWIEIPNAVDKVAFTWEEWLAIQQQLDRNRESSPRNQKLNYLLKGMLFCGQCGQRYYCVPIHGKPYYRCRGRKPLLSTIRCANKTVSGRLMEPVIWEEVAKALKNPDLLLAELQRQKESGEGVNHLEDQLELNQKRLKTIDEAETRYLRLYGAGLLAEEKLTEECQRIKQERTKLMQDIAELEERIEASSRLALDIDNVQQVCGLVAGNLDNFTFEQKRFALQALNIKVWVDRDSLRLEGVLPIPEVQFTGDPSAAMFCQFVSQ